MKSLPKRGHYIILQRFADAYIVLFYLLWHHSHPTELKIKEGRSSQVRQSGVGAGWAAAVIYAHPYNEFSCQFNTCNLRYSQITLSAYTDSTKTNNSKNNPTHIIVCTSFVQLWLEFLGLSREVSVLTTSVQIGVRPPIMSAFTSFESLHESWW